MKRYIVFLIGLFCIFQLAACKDMEENRLTLEKIIELSQKGKDLAWADFQDYPHEDEGSGIRIYVFDVDDYELAVGVAGEEDIPLYIRLVSKKSGDYIDIREESVENFINKRNSK